MRPPQALAVPTGTCLLWDRVQPTAVCTGYTHNVQTEAALRTGEGPVTSGDKHVMDAPGLPVMLTTDTLELHKDELVYM